MRFFVTMIGISYIVKLYVFSLISGLSDNFLNFNMIRLSKNEIHLLIIESHKIE